MKTALKINRSHENCGKTGGRENINSPSGKVLLSKAKKIKSKLNISDTSLRFFISMLNIKFVGIQRPIRIDSSQNFNFNCKLIKISGTDK